MLRPKAGRNEIKKLYVYKEDGEGEGKEEEEEARDKFEN